MKVIGITGGIGSGKSTACRIFASLGIPVFNSDEAARKLYEEHGFRNRAIKLLGKSILTRGGSVDKGKIAAIVFSDPAALRKLNALIHPEVRRRFRRWVRAQKGAPYVLKEAAIMIESGAIRDIHKLIVIKSDKLLIFNRLLKNGKWSMGDVKRRMAGQISDKKRLQYADFVLINDNRHSLVEQVVKIHQKLVR